MHKSIIKEIKQQNKEHEFQGIFRMLIYHHFSVPITSILVRTKITPNLVTSFSLILAFIASIFYFRADYSSLVIGTIILNIAIIFDYVDGELARYKKLNSAFGAWWDSICDRITEYVIFSSLILGLYFKTTNLAILILGLFALANLIMISTIRGLSRAHFDFKKQKHEIRFGKKFYLASADTFVMLVTITALLNKVYYLLWIYAVLGAVIWLRQIYRTVINIKA